MRDADSGQKRGTGDEKRYARMIESELDVSSQIDRFRRRYPTSHWTKPVGDEEDRRSHYAEFMKSNRVHPDVVFFESMSGAKMMDSPFALFEHLVNEKKAGLNRFLFIWSVRSLEVVPEPYQNHPDVIFVKRHTRDYFHFLTRAKFIVGNSTFPDYFVRNTDQRYLNTWHGIGFKSLGRSDLSPLGAQQAVYNMLQATHVISPCPLMTDVHRHGFSMQGVHAGSIAEVGYPRIDLTLNSSVDDRQALAEELGLVPGKKTVLYAPTWRGTEFDVARLVDDLTNLSRMDVNIVFLGHHLMLRHLKGVDLESVILPSSNLNTNRLLSIVDVLITDYSSIFFDVLRTATRIVHYVYDYEEYRATRGLSLSLDELPGAIAHSSSELLVAVRDALVVGPRPLNEDAVSRFSPNDNGQSTKAVARWFFENDASSVNVVTSANILPRVIFWGGRMDSTEVTDEFLAELVSAAENSNVEVSLLVARSVTSLPTVMETLDRLGENVSVITRGSYPFAMTEDERRARASLNAQSLPESRGLYSDIYHREYRRIFGDARFDAVVLHPHLSRFWKELARYATK